MGKGLGLQKDSKGMHLVFAAGTGMLCFVDIVGKMILGQLGIIPMIDRLHPDFKLKIYASYRSEEEAIALDLLKALDKIQKKAGLKDYSLFMKLSVEKINPGRWNNQFIQKEIEEI